MITLEEMRKGLEKHLITVTIEKFNGVLKVIKTISSQSQTIECAIMLSVGHYDRQLNIPTRCDVHSTFDPFHFRRVFTLRK